MEGGGLAGREGSGQRKGQGNEMSEGEQGEEVCACLASATRCSIRHAVSVPPHLCL